MADVKVFNKKTKQEEVQPERVAKLLSNIYRIIGPIDGDRRVKTPDVQADVQAAPKQVEPIQTLETVISSEKSQKKESADASDEKADLRAEYEKLTGKNPGGRMTVESLKKAIEEHGQA